MKGDLRTTVVSQHKSLSETPGHTPPEDEDTGCLMWMLISRDIWNTGIESGIDKCMENQINKQTEQI